MNCRNGQMTRTGAGIAIMVGLLMGTSALADADVDNDAIARQVNEALGLGDSVLEVVDITGLPGEDAVAIVPLGGYLYTVTVEPHSVRAPGYRVVTQTGPDTYEEFEPGPVMTGVNVWVVQMPCRSGRPAGVRGAVQRSASLPGVWAPTGPAANNPHTMIAERFIR